MRDSTPRFVPVDESRRIVSLDVLRGFALLGILAVNAVPFSMPEAAAFNPAAYGDMEGANRLIWIAVHAFGELKFQTLFTVLFGAGIVLMTGRCEEQGLSATGLHYRRMMWLIVFGLMHGNLVWYGDILYWYGMCGLVVFLFRKLQPRWLLFWGILFTVIPSALMLLSGLAAESEGVRSAIADLDPSPEVIVSEVAAYRGSWLEQMTHRVPSAVALETFVFLFWALWRVSGVMLVGMALYKMGVLSAKRSRSFYVALVAVALLVGMPIIGIGIQHNFTNQWVSTARAYLIGVQHNYWASLLVGLGWIGTVMLLCQSAVLGWLKRALAAVGRMAFSNYILQTLICTSIFYGHGLGLFGKVERTGLALIVLAIWILQLTISPIWLRHFRFGPLEWVWRSLSYMKLQPFRR